MKIHELKINNFGSYVGAHFLILDNRGLVLIEGDNQDEFKMDSNGSGKSQIPDALDWCITGVIPRGDHVDSIINDSQNDCYVEIILFTDDNTPISIQRKRTRKKKTELRLFVNDQNVTALDTRETQKLIYHHLGIDRDILHSTVLFAQTDLVHYADSTDSKRMEILTSLLQLDTIDDLLVKVKDELKKLNSQQDKFLGSVESIQSSLQLSKKVDYDYPIDKWEMDREGEIDRLNEQLIEASNRLGKMSHPSSVDSIKKSISDLESKILPEEKDESILREINNRYTKCIQSLGSAEANLNNKQKELDGINKSIQSGNAICPTCGQHYPATELSNRLLVIQNELQNFERQYTVLATELDTINIEHNDEMFRVNEAHKEIVGQNVILRNSIEAQKIALAKLEDQNELYATLSNAINSLQSQIVFRQNEINPYVKVKQGAMAQIEEMEKSLVDYNLRLQSISQLKTFYEFWVEGFGPKGLKSYILDSKLKELNDSINYWVKILTGGTIWVELGSYKVNRSNKVVNSPDVKVCRWNTDGTITTRDYKSWSGGEKQRISLAIDFGLSRIIANRSVHTYDIVFLDEIFKHLDRGGKESVMEMLKVLAKEKSSVFVVEHDSEFKSMFDNKICVTKKDGKSSIKEFTNNEFKKQNEEVKSKNVSVGAVRGRTSFKRVPIK